MAGKIYISVTLDPAFHASLMEEATKRGMSLQNIIRERLGTPPVALGRPVLPQSGSRYEEQRLAEFKHYTQRVADLRAMGAPIPPFLSEMLAKVKAYLTNVGLLDIRTGKLFAEKPATLAASPERADSDAKKTTKRKK